MATPSKIYINGSARRSDHTVQKCTQNTAASLKCRDLLEWRSSLFSEEFHVRSNRGAWVCQGLFSLAFILALILYLIPPYSLWEGVEFIPVIAQESNETWLPMRVWRMHNDFGKTLSMLMTLTGKSLLVFLNEYWYMKLNVTLFQTWPDFQILSLIWLIEFICVTERFSDCHAWTNICTY